MLNQASIHAFPSADGYIGRQMTSSADSIEAKKALKGAVTLLDTGCMTVFRQADSQERTLMVLDKMHSLFYRSTNFQDIEDPAAIYYWLLEQKQIAEDVEGILNALTEADEGQRFRPEGGNATSLQMASARGNQNPQMV